MEILSNKAFNKVLITKIMVCTDIPGAHPACVKKFAKLTDNEFISDSEIPQDVVIKVHNPCQVIYTVRYDGRTNLLFNKELISLVNQ